MQIIVTGATGFIVKALSVQLLGVGYDVVALSRNPGRGRELLGDGVTVLEWDGESSKGW